MIYTGQKIELNTTFTEDGTALNIAGGTVTFDYWLPGNSSITPDGSITGEIIEASLGTATADFPALSNTLPGQLKIQAVLTLSGESYRGQTTYTTIYPVGC